VRGTIISGLGGGSEADDVLDLMEIVAMLLIPTFLKAADTDTEEIGAEGEKEEPRENRKSNKNLPEGVAIPPLGLLDYVLKMILHDVSFQVQELNWRFSGFSDTDMLNFGHSSCILRSLEVELIKS
jgi:hypothetical protein